MKRTKDVLQIIKRDLDKDARLRSLVAEERVNYRAALAIKTARKKAGLTQAELAREVGTTQSVIARLENASYTGHSLRMLENIAEALGTRVEIRLRPAPDRRSLAYAR